ncbi:ladinin-1 isoform X1 [Monodelphis domestica]|uniref:ladinin-1 isoform X1 n=1 Tax=Monodelphis domestica TaxID=13616 RepID=UPI0024E1DD31|nr:ladinin-1 isoform X1 [Monodelphis domestica]
MAPASHVVLFHVPWFSFPNCSLAMQRTLEDEEEQERERRRRHRNLSSTTDDEAPKVTHNGDQPAVERLPSLEEAEAPKLHSSVKDEEDENFQAVLRTRQERRLRRQALETSQSPIKEQLEVEEKKESQGAVWVTQQPPVPQKEIVPPPRRRLSQKQRGPWARDEKSLEGRETKEEKTLDQRTVSAPERTPVQDQSASEKKIASEKTPVQDQTVPEKKLASEKTPVQDQTVPEKKLASEKTPVQDQTVPEKKLALGKTPASEKVSVLEKTLTPEETLAPKKSLAGEKPMISVKTSGQEKALVLEKVSASEESLTPKKVSARERALAFERASAQEKTLNPEKGEKGSTREKVLTLEKNSAQVKATASKKLSLEQAPVQAQEQKDSEKGVPEKKEPQIKETSKKSPSSEGPGEEKKSEPQVVASRFRPFTLQVKIPSKEAETELASPTQISYSSSLRRSSPRTISFRMSPRKENPETTFTRSASVRLPSNTVKLGEKLERYHTAIQRSESVKCPGSSRTEFFVAPVGVASKRSLFEKEQVRNSRAEPPLSRKEDLRLSGVVTSRLNLWISRSQDAGGDQDSQDVRKEATSTKRTSWGKQATSPTDS